MHKVQWAVYLAHGLSIYCMTGFMLQAKTKTNVHSSGDARINGFWTRCMSERPKVRFWCVANRSNNARFADSDHSHSAPITLLRSLIKINAQRDSRRSAKARPPTTNVRPLGGIWKRPRAIRSHGPWRCLCGSTGYTGVEPIPLRNLCMVVITLRSVWSDRTRRTLTASRSVSRSLDGICTTADFLLALSARRRLSVP